MLLGTLPVQSCKRQQTTEVERCTPGQILEQATSEPELEPCAATPTFIVLRALIPGQLSIEGAYTRDVTLLAPGQKNGKPPWGASLFLKHFPPLSLHHLVTP